MPRGVKRLGYLDQGGSSQEAHQAHWDGFTFTGGPWKVQCKGQAGNLQVWASSQAEGERVIRHALTAAGLSPTDEGLEWSALRVDHPRFQRQATYTVKVWNGAPVVTKRNGPDGPPELEGITL